MENIVYDQIAEEYKESKQLSFRKYVEEYTLFKISGDISNQSVLDLACGEGHYTRKLKSAGAQKVVGVDISPEMIVLANKEEAKHPTACKYLVSDVATIPDLGAFDLVSAMYLLNYAQTKEQLLSFCKAAYKHLKEGGRFVGVNDNVQNKPEHYQTYAKYGFVKAGNAQAIEGDPITYIIQNSDGTTFQFDNYYLSPQTYAEAFAEAGFVNFQWEGPFLEPAQRCNNYWNAFMQHPPIIGFSAQKQ